MESIERIRWWQTVADFFMEAAQRRKHLLVLSVSIFQLGICEAVWLVWQRQKRKILVEMSCISGIKCTMTHSWVCTVSWTTGLFPVCRVSNLWELIVRWNYALGSIWMEACGTEWCFGTRQNTVQKRKNTQPRLSVLHDESGEQMYTWFCLYYTGICVGGCCNMCCWCIWSVRK